MGTKICFSPLQLPQLEFSATPVTHMLPAPPPLQTSKQATSQVLHAIYCREIHDMRRVKPVHKPQFKLVRTFLIIFQIEPKRRQFSAVSQAFWQNRETPGNPTKLRTAAPGVSCDFSFITPWHQIWVRARQVMTLTVSWKPTGSGGWEEGEKKKYQTPPPHAHQKVDLLF